MRTLPKGRAALFDETEPGCMRGFEATIDVEDTTPWFARLWSRSAQASSEKIEFKTVLDQGAKQKVDCASSCTSPYMLVEE